MRAAGFYCGMGRKGMERLEVRGVIRRALGQPNYQLSHPGSFRRSSSGWRKEGVLTGLQMVE